MSEQARSPFQIRCADFSDGWALAQLLIDCFKDMPGGAPSQAVLNDANREDSRALLTTREKGVIVIAEAEGEICGTVSLFATHAAGSEVWRHGGYGLRHLAVAREQRGRGLGRLLLGQAEALAFERGANCLCVHIPAGSPRLAALFTTRGYLRDPSGDFDRGSFAYWEGYYLPAAKSLSEGLSAEPAASPLSPV
ncbi:hypothetical protein LMIY3S_05587 [Labrys miyagiensis]